MVYYLHIFWEIFGLCLAVTFWDEFVDSMNSYNNLAHPRTFLHQFFYK